MKDLKKDLSKEKTNEITFNFRVIKQDLSVDVLVAKLTEIDQVSTDNILNFRIGIYDAKSLLDPQLVAQQNSITFTSMLKYTRDFIYFKDKHHTLIVSSQTMADITGFSSGEEHAGLNDYDMFPKEHADVYYGLEKQIFQGYKSSIVEV